MKERKLIWLHCSILAVILIIAVYAPIPALAAEVWSDDFDDGNLNGWQILTGGFDVSDGYANATLLDVNELYGWHNYFNAMNRSSTVVVGTWSFDWLVPVNVYGDGMWNGRTVYPGVHFISAGNYSASNLPSHSGYALKIGSGANPVFRLMKVTNCSNDLLASYVSEKDWNDWFHIDVTRNDDGEFNVWIDGEHRMRFTDTDYSESTNLIVDFLRNSCIDNVTVSDTIDLTPPSTETTTTTTTTDETTTTDTTTEVGLPIELLAIGVGGAIVLIVIVVFLRKR